MKFYWLKVFFGFDGVGFGSVESVNRLLSQAWGRSNQPPCLAPRSQVLQNPSRDRVRHLTTEIGIG